MAIYSHKCKLKVFRGKESLMMAYIKPKLVVKNLFSRVVYDCILRNLYWFDNTPGMKSS